MLTQILSGRIRGGVPRLISISYTNTLHVKPKLCSSYSQYESMYTHPFISTSKTLTSGMIDHRGASLIMSKQHAANLQLLVAHIKACHYQQNRVSTS